MYELHKRIKQYMGDRPEYRKGNLEYVRSQLKYITQEEVIDMLKDMSLEELRYAQGAGIPGHANIIAMELIRVRKEERNKFMDKEKIERIPETKVERNLMLTTAPSLNPPAPHRELKDEYDPNTVSVSTDDTKTWEDPAKEKKEDEEDDA